MALPARMGAFMVGAAFGSAQCFYWLREDVKHVGDAMDRKIDAISEEIQEKERKSALALEAMEAAVSGVKNAVTASPTEATKGS